MLERVEPVLKWVSLGLAALLLAQVVGALRRVAPSHRTSVPEAATWSPPAPPTNAVAGGGGGPGMPPGMMRPGMGPMGGGGGLDPAAQARVDRLVQSELLGPVMRPPPMALLGIAGKDVFLRAPNGQSGLVQEGGELGGVQLVRIGTNRVLVKENGEEKELVIFEGIGGESLLQKRKEGTP